MTVDFLFFVTWSWLVPLLESSAACAGGMLSVHSLVRRL